MNHRASIFFALIFLVAAVAFAHGEKRHVLGKVIRINPDSIVVRQTDGKSVEVKIVETTVFLKNGQPAKLSDLTVGDRTAIHATPKGKILEADEVKFRALPRTQASKKAQP